MGDSQDDDSEDEKPETPAKPEAEQPSKGSTASPDSPEVAADDERIIKKTDYFARSGSEPVKKETLWRIPGHPKVEKSEEKETAGPTGDLQNESQDKKQEAEFSFADRMQILRDQSPDESNSGTRSDTWSSRYSSEKNESGGSELLPNNEQPEIIRKTEPVMNREEPVEDKPEEKSEPVSGLGESRTDEESGIFEPVEEQETHPDVEPEPMTDPEPVSASIPEAEPEPESETDDLEAPDELEKVSADNFAPMREILVSREKKREMPPSEIQRLRESSVKTEQPKKPEEEKIAKAQPDGKSGKRARAARRLEDVQPPSPISMLMLYGGGIALIGASIALAMGVTGTGSTALGVIGSVLVGSFALINRLWFRIALSSRGVRYGTNVSIAILSLAGIMIFLNVLSYRYHYRIDMSSEGLHSLSPQTIGVLEDINRTEETITVTAFTPPDDGYRQGIENLMDMYLYHTNKIDFSFVDPDVQRELAESRGIERNPAILFELGDRRSITSDISEPNFTSALLAVRQTNYKVVSFVTGHGEPSPFTDDSTQSGLSKFKAQLELEGYEVNTLDIPQENGVPPETSLLVIVSPERQYSLQEIDAVRSYLADGGNAMFLLESGQDGGFGGLLSEYGIVPNNDALLDDERNAFGEVSSPTLAANPEHTISSGLSDSWDLLVLNAESLGFSAQRLPGVTVESLARSSGSSWSETLDSRTFDDDVDIRESRDVAAIATRELDSAEILEEFSPEETVVENPDETSNTGIETEENQAEPADTGAGIERVAQVMVVGDSSFALNANIDSYYNKDFIMNSVNFLTSRQDLISIRPNMREDRPLDISKGQQKLIFAISVVLTPLLIAAIGGLVWWRRR